MKAEYHEIIITIHSSVKYTARAEHTATLLPTGKVLVVGDYNFNEFYV